jgi:hypothetical protein
MAWYNSLRDLTHDIASPVEHNRDFLGNALKNVSPLAFLIPGLGPMAAAGLGAAGSALGRGIQHGANIGDILKQGAQGGAEAYGGAQGMNALKAAFAPSSSAAGTVASGVPGAAGAGGPGGASNFLASQYNPAVNVGGISMAAPQAAALPSAATGGGSMFSDAARGVGSFLKANPMAVGQGLQGLGQMSQANSENRLRNAQAGITEQELAAMKNRTAALQPLYQALLGQQQGVRPNPYGNPSGGAR